jgi:glycosyltransferase involved in cell wall biosynthesis
MKVAIVHDWFVTYAGAERVVEQLLELYPEADLFSTVDFLPEGQRDFIKNKKIHTTFIQHLPGARKHYRSYLPLMPLAIEQLDLSGYDLIISSSSCVSKGVITGPDQVHISYVHSPIRYAWDLTHQYLEEANLNHGIKGWLAKVILHYMRMWDIRTANGVDYYLANSKFIARRIKKVYGREAKVIYPPVDIESFSYCEEKGDYYLTASRLVPYKKVKLIVEAFNEMPDKKLLVIGDGPDFSKIKSIARANIILMGYQPFEVLKEKMQHAKAFVFAAEEDFGITPVEAQACGTPVIAYGKGGALETIKENETGIFFYQQDVESIVDAVTRLESLSVIEPQKCRENAERFAIRRFKKETHEYIDGVSR